MKKLLLIAILVFAGLLGRAQKGMNYIGIAAEAGIPTGAFSDIVNAGFGGSLKLLLGIAEEGQVSFASGYSAFRFKGIPSGSGVKANFSVIPLLVGYRHNFNGVYLEPQLGIASYKISASGNGQSASDSEVGFTFAAGVGYVINGLDLGLRYQHGKIQDADEAISFIGIHVGYNFLLKGTRR